MIDATALDSIIIAAGWTLIHFLWQGAILGALFFGAMSLMRDATANSRYWVGMLFLGAMLAAAVVTFCLCYDPGVGRGVVRTEASVVTSAVGGFGVAKFWPGLQQRIELWLPWTVLAWLTGVVAISGSLMLDYLQIRRLSVEGVRPLRPEVQAVVDRLLHSLRLSPVVRVLESTRVAVPMVIGWIRPVILVPPSAFMGLSPTQLELIISHELAHVRRLDYLSNLLQIVIETVLFYHPAVRAVSIRVRLERENCCDDVVVAQTGDSIAYARALTEVEGLRCSSGMRVTLAATGGHLRGRVRRLVSSPAEQRGAIDWAGGLVMLAISIGVAVSGASWVSESSAPRFAGAGNPAAAPAPASISRAAPPAPREMSPAPENAALQTAGEPVPGRTAPASALADMPTPNAPVAAPGEPGTEVRATNTAPAVVGAEPRGPVPPAAQPSESAPGPVHPAPGAPEPSMTPPPRPAKPQAPPVPGGSAAASSVKDGEPIVVARERISGGRLVKARQPTYPRRARIGGIVGVVTVTFDVTEMGRLEDVAVVDSTSPIFEGTVLKALESWRYEPFLLDNEPVRARVSRTFQFELEAGQAALSAEKSRCRKVTGSRLCRSRPAYDDLSVVVVYNSALD